MNYGIAYSQFILTYNLHFFGVSATAKANSMEEDLVVINTYDPRTRLEPFKSLPTLPTKSKRPEILVDTVKAVISNNKEFGRHKTSRDCCHVQNEL